MPGADKPEADNFVEKEYLGQLDQYRLWNIWLLHYCVYQVCIV